MNKCRMSDLQEEIRKHCVAAVSRHRIDQKVTNIHHTNPRVLEATKHRRAIVVKSLAHKRFMRQNHRFYGLQEDCPFCAPSFASCGRASVQIEVLEAIRSRWVCKTYFQIPGASSLTCHCISPLSYFGKVSAVPPPGTYWI